LQEATELGKKAKELKKAAESLHQEERGGAKGRKHRKNVKAVEKVRKCWRFIISFYCVIFRWISLLAWAFERIII
jgi:hypothetical protein